MYLYRMKTQNVWKYVWIVLIISFVLGVLIHFENIIYNFIPDSESLRVSHRQVGLSDTITDVFISSMVAFLTFIINYFIIRPFDNNIKIDLKKISVAVILTLVSITILSDLLFTFKHLVTSDNNPQRLNLLYTFRDIFIAIVVITGVYFIKIVNDKQAIRIENEKLKNENLKSQYESLKNQVSPHFLFNSLTALKELISQDPGKAQEYINHLSFVMRYTLQSNQSMTHRLCDELLVADSYLFLAKIRFGNNLIIAKKIDSKYNFHLLPPLAVQTLIENAVKHNEISKRNPLKIRIETTDNQSLKVINALQEKVTPEHSSGMGLTNLTSQYRFLSGKDINITRSIIEFMVELPLLTPDNNESPDS